MGKLEELDKLDKAIKDAEIRIKSVQANIEQLEKEISVLSPRKGELEQNIEFHKKEGTVPIAHEYKKAKAELSKVTARLILITSDQKKAIQACKDIDAIINKWKNDQYQLIKTNENNVLKVLFGGERGKK